MTTALAVIVLGVISTIGWVLFYFTARANRFLREYVDRLEQTIDSMDGRVPERRAGRPVNPNDTTARVTRGRMSNGRRWSNPHQE